jgi:hypothetical protein
MALALPDAVELPHFERSSFRIHKKIFATLDIKENLACLMFDPVQQSVFCAFDKSIIYPVPNKWGLKGATYIDLKKVRQSVVKDALRVAYDLLTQKKKKA